MSVEPRRRELLLHGGALVLSLGVGELAFGATIVGVRIWPARDYTRVTIESDQPLSARHSLVDSPARLVVDVDGLGLDASLRELVGRVVASDPYIAALRVGQFQPRVVRLVFDLKQPVAPQQFALEPVAAYRHRLVFDLHPLREVDPLLALLQEREAALAPFRAAEGAASAAAESVPAAAPSPASAAAPSAASAALPSAGAGSERRRVDRLVIVAIDPGHGGEDPGAIGPGGLREKDVVLRVAWLLRERLDAVPGMRAMLTRDGDHFVPLRDRVNKARRVQADLFVSIHADAAPRGAAQGASVFALSTSGATSSMARWMAERENAADMVGGVNVAVQDAQVMRTLLDMSTTAQIKDSLKLGQQVLGRLARIGTLHKKRVEQAGFAVLKAPDVPSILVETAFISNPDEELKLRDPQYRSQLADAVAAGIRRYLSANPPLARNRQI